MRKLMLIVSAFVMLSCNAANAQVERRGNDFVMKSNPRSKKDTIVTSHSIEYNKEMHKIILNKKDGVCYFYYTAKSGRVYPKRLVDESNIWVSKEIAKEYGVDFTYVKKTRK